MNKIRTIVGVSAFASLAFAGAASASSVSWIAPSAYLSADDSPFAGNNVSGGSFWLEDFEDGLLNTPGVSASGGQVLSPSSNTDSIDGDGNGSIDGWGTGGYSFNRANTGGANSIVFSFDANALGGLPTMAGLVWTDGGNGAMITFEAFDGNGASLGVFNAGVLSNGDPQGSTAEDRFLGARFDGGISAIRIMADFGGLEIDHLQYGFTSTVVPLPAPVAMGLAGLGIVGVASRRRRKS